MSKVDSAEPEGLGKELWTAVDKSRPQLRKAAETKAAQGWLKPELETPEGTQRVYGMMEDLVAKPGFLTNLTKAQQQRDLSPSEGKTLTPTYPDIVYLEADWWEALPPQEGSAIMTSEPPTNDKSSLESKEGAVSKPEALDSYVMVEKEDVLEAIGSFVAAYLAELPQAQDLPPAELQLAIKRAFKELRKSKMQQLWGWGRAIYRCVSFSYGAFTVYENPWLVRALLTAMWTASRVMFGLLI